MDVTLGEFSMNLVHWPILFLVVYVLDSVSYNVGHDPSLLRT